MLPGRVLALPVGPRTHRRRPDPALERLLLRGDRRRECSPPAPALLPSPPTVGGAPSRTPSRPCRRITSSGAQVLVAFLPLLRTLPNAGLAAIIL